VTEFVPFREVTKAEFKAIYDRHGGAHTGWTPEYWRTHFDDAPRPGWKFVVQEPASPEHDQMWIVSDHATKEYRLVFLTESSTESFFEGGGA
jgi:hypothetical protein